MQKRKLNFIKCRLKYEPYLTFKQKTWRTFTESELREAVGTEADGEVFSWNTILQLMLATNNKYNEDFFREVYENTLKELPTFSKADQLYVAEQLEEFAKRIIKKKKQLSYK